MSRWTVYRRAFLAIALPVTIGVVSMTTLPRALLESAAMAWWTELVAVVIAVGLAVLEWHFLGVFLLLIKAKGGIDRFGELLEDPADRLRRRRWKFRQLTAVVAAVAALLLAEVVFRIFDIRPVTVVDRLPRAVDESLNALGIREDWDSLADDDARLRIAFLGDSFVFGVSVARDDSFVHLVETMLTGDGFKGGDGSEDGDGPDGGDGFEGVVTINLGKPATHPGTQLAIFNRLKNELRPDIVVQVIYLNDLGVNLRRLLLDLTFLRSDRLFVGNFSRVLTFAETQIRYWMIWNKTFGYYRGGLTPAQRDASWDRFKRDVRACRRAVEQSGATYALVMFPWLYNLDKYELTDVHHKMAEFAAELGVPYHDLLDDFAGRDGKRLRLGGDDDHPNEAGHRIAAEALTRFLREEVIPEWERVH